MAVGGRGGNKTTALTRGHSLRDQAHQEILDCFKIARENSDDPAIRDAAISLAKDKNLFRQRQTARLSPTLAMVFALLILILAGLASWYFFVSYAEHLAYTLTGIVVSLAVIGVCFLAMFAGQLSQANFLAVLKMIWSKISDMIPTAQGHTVPNPITAEQDSGESEGDGT